MNTYDGAYTYEINGISAFEVEYRVHFEVSDEEPVIHEISLLCHDATGYYERPFPAFLSPVVSEITAWLHANDYKLMNAAEPAAVSAWEARVDHEMCRREVA